MVAVGDYIQTFIRKNSEDLDLPFMGVNREKQIVPTSANTENIDRRKYSILKCGEFVFSGMQTGRDVCIRIALSEIKTDILLSPAYTTFRVDPTKPILPEYFFLNFKSYEMEDGLRATQASALIWIGNDFVRFRYRCRRSRCRGRLLRYTTVQKRQEELLQRQRNSLLKFAQR